MIWSLYFSHSTPPANVQINLTTPFCDFSESFMKFSRCSWVIVLGLNLSSSATTFDLRTRFAASSALAASSLVDARSFACPADFIAPPSCPVSWMITRSLTLDSFEWPHHSTKRPTSKIDHPIWSSLCTNLFLSLGFGVTQNRLMNLWNSQTMASGPSTATPMITSQIPAQDTHDQKLSSEASIALMEKLAKRRRIGFYVTTLALVVHLVLRISKRRCA